MVAFLSPKATRQGPPGGRTIHGWRSTSDAYFPEDRYAGRGAPRRPRTRGLQARGNHGSDYRFENLNPLLKWTVSPRHALPREEKMVRGGAAAVTASEQKLGFFATVLRGPGAFG